MKNESWTGVEADIEPTDNPLFPWRLSAPCRSYAEATAKKLHVDSIEPLAFLPTYGVAVALADGELATGGGMATHVDESAPELTPEQKAFLARAEAGEDVIDALNFDKTGVDA